MVQLRPRRRGALGPGGLHGRRHRSPTAAELRADLDDFVGANGATIARIRAEHPDCTPAQVAHDFWLTRNRHGAGFWDRGYGEDGDTLTEAAHAYGGVDLYIGEDGRIHC
ncbi:hypothetical protein [Microlunatus ginsengisoli]|uniref:Uncharacterized protein n=1 Tax=Microlunatus ginsengisoli TaxID=363863 RepID=A0ABP7AIA5_9ACTN